MAAQITVGAPPTICTSSDYSYETKLSVPTGWVFIAAGDSGWGPEGSVWNVSTGAGAKLTGMEAKCQGSSCTSIYGNPENNGTMKERADGSWYMDVTANMQPSLMISGLLLSDTSGQNNSYPLDILGVPPCGLPVANNCTSRNFTVDHQQWEAYQVDTFMKSYLVNNNINDFDAFRKKAMEDFEPTMTADSKICDITDPNFNCLPPQWSDCNTNSDVDTVRGVIMTTAIIEFTNFVAMLYAAVSTVSGRIGDEIDEIVTNFWVPAATETWDKIMSVVSSIVGILIAAFVLLDAFLPEAAWTTGLVAAAITASNAFGIAGNTANLISNPGNTDTEFKQSAGYKVGAQNMLGQVMNGFEVLYTNDKIGQDNINKIIGGGNWVGEEITKAFSTQGVGSDSTEWYEKLMVAQFITKALTDNDAFVLFIPYGSNIQYNGKKWGFDQKTCQDHWIDDPSWGYYAACDIPFGPNGEPGMSVFTRPSSEGSASKAWADKPLNYQGQNITGWDIMSSSIWGQQEHGFNFTFLDQNFTNTLSEGGLTAAENLFKNVAINQPGLYNVPVCVVQDLVYIPGVNQVMSDINNSPFSGGYYHADNPCPCGNYIYTSPDGNKGQFTDFVSQKVKDSIGGSCAVSGDMWSPTLMSTPIYM
jgi:hypothetical protein